MRQSADQHETDLATAGQPAEMQWSVDELLPPRVVEAPAEVAPLQRVSKPWRRFRQYSLRGLLILQLLIATLCGLFLVRLNTMRHQQAVRKTFEGRSHCHLTGDTASPKWFWSRVERYFDLPSGDVTDVYIGDAPLSRDEAARIATLSQVRDLTLIRGVTEPAVFDELSRLTKLKRLSLLDAERRHLDDAKLSRVVQLREVEWMTIHSTGVTNESLARLAQMSNLESLDIQYARMNFSGLRPLIARNRLQSLSLCIRLEEQDCEELTRFTSLQYLEAPGVSSAGAAVLKRMPNLRRVKKYR